MTSEIVVSIVCNAYNQEPYIRQCLESLVGQRTGFPFEILVHDDASTDGTAAIIREYASRYPELIRPIYQTENQYSRGRLLEFQFPRARGRYIAMCEGDDYWTDPLKLRRQVDALDAHPEVDICAHAATQLDASANGRAAPIAPRDRDAVIPVEEVISGGGLFVATSSLMFRASLNDRVPEFRRLLRLDYTLQIQGALRGGMLYLSRNMSVYRYRTPGSWTLLQRGDIERQRAHFNRVKAMLEQLDAETRHRYRAVIDRRIAKYEAGLLKSEFHHYRRQRAYRQLLDRRYAAIFRGLSLRERCGIRLFAALPWSHALWKSLKSHSRA